MDGGAFQNLRAVGYVFAGSVIYALIFASLKLTDGAVRLGPIMFLRYFGSVLTLVAFMCISGQPLRMLQSRQRGLHFLRALFAVSGVGAVIFASSKMPVLDATAISMLHVIGVVGLAAVVLGERLTVHVIAGSAISTIGAATVMVSGGAFSSVSSALLFPSLVALAAAMLFALDAFLLKICSQLDSPLSTLMHVNAFALALTLVPCIVTWENSASVGTIALLFAFGPLAIGAQFLIFRAYAAAPLSIVAPVDYSLLAASCFIGIVLFDEIPTSGSLVGSAMIAAGAVVVALAKSKVRRRSIKSRQ
ncbi:DMT family transporter [Mesorhizobium sp.]|uniref:DMT family transporter n=1 Tax=Mesorhizobium sp. TaxID=1871066 RepID=UPI000FE88A63|nr:DMT family transporter [Mesorhizobium sp.]RWJ05700.1 MAG: DMT family transporter [Mesorhizobium sp.]